MPKIQEMLNSATNCQSWKEYEWNSIYFWSQNRKSSDLAKILMLPHLNKAEEFYDLKGANCIVGIPIFQNEQQIYAKETRDYFVYKYGEAIKHDQLEIIVRQAQKYLGYSDNWDDEGSPGYSKDTLERAKSILEKYCKYIKKKHNTSAPLPKINPGPGGSFDLYWNSEEKAFLLNVPKDPRSPLSYYGDGDRLLNSTKGTLDEKKPNEFVFDWIYSECTNDVHKRRNSE